MTSLDPVTSVNQNLQMAVTVSDPRHPPTASSVELGKVGEVPKERRELGM